MAIQSMTGFGFAAEQLNNRQYTIEAKSVNSRFLEVRVRLPREYSSWEEKIVSLCRKSFKRGRIDINLSVVGQEKLPVAVNLHQPLLEGYHKALMQIKEKFKLKEEIDLQLLSRFREIFIVEEENLDLTTEFEKFSPLLQQALQALEKMRQEEGEKLLKDIKKRFQNIEKLAQTIEKKSADVCQIYRQKLKERLAKVDNNFNLEESRLEQEVIFHAEKSDITEEIVRLNSHLKKAASSLKEKKSVGRQIDFLLQEMNREVNTLSVKIQDANISHLAVEIKGELERVKEQIQNIQ